MSYHCGDRRDTKLLLSLPQLLVMPRSALQGIRRGKKRGRRFSTRLHVGERLINRRASC